MRFFLTVFSLQPIHLSSYNFFYFSHPLPLVARARGERQEDSFCSDLLTCRR
jgi:hypothetical protein